MIRDYDTARPTGIDEFEPSPIEHALSIMNSIPDLDEARSICRANALNAAPDDDFTFIYWAMVLKAIGRYGQMPRKDMN